MTEKTASSQTSQTDISAGAESPHPAPAHNARDDRLHSQVYDAIFQQAPVGITIALSSRPETADQFCGEEIEINPMYERITGRKKEALIQLGWEQITHPDDLAEELVLYRKLQAGEIDRYELEKRIIRPDGTAVWVQISVTPISLPGQAEKRFICLMQDISRRKQTEQALLESERSKTVLLSHLPGMAYRCLNDADRTMLFVSAGCRELTGYPPESLLQNSVLSYNQLIAPEYRSALRKKWDQNLTQRRPFRYEYEIITAEQQRKWVLEMGEGIYDAAGEVVALEGIILDISEQKALESSLRYFSEHDSLTALFNRRYLISLLREESGQKTRGKRALVGINLSELHLLNIPYGFRYTQALVQRLVEAIAACCDSHHRFFSIYEYQFAFYVKGYREQDELLSFCAMLSRQLAALLATERVRGGIGVVEIDQKNRCDVERLLQFLQIASEHHVDVFDGTDNVCLFDTAMEAQILRKDEIRRELAQIAAGQGSDRLFLQFQPCLDLKTGQICGFEALARLKSEKYGLVPPLDFIPIAEETKLIIPLGERILRLALRFLQAVQQCGCASVPVSVNISAIQLLHEGFAQNLLGIIREAGVDPAAVNLEITESVFNLNYQEVNAILAGLQRQGIQAMIDDFGTGYSSLARERELNVTCLKIDQYFIDKLRVLDERDVITGDIISMAHKLGHSVVAEGVEDEKQLNYLQKHGCDKIQGYLISRPLDFSAALDFLQNRFTPLIPPG